jgi:RimJ/RimL family protein N-acetyltransferase
MADVPIELAVHNLRAAQDSCVLLGDGGVVLYFPVQPGLMAQGHIHIWDPQWYGRVEILKKLNRWAMKKWDLLRLTVQPPKRNKLANKLAQDLGFTQEGVLRSAVRYNEGVDDLVVYGLLREEG